MKRWQLFFLFLLCVYAYGEDEFDRCISILRNEPLNPVRREQSVKSIVQMGPKIVPRLVTIFKNDSSIRYELAQIFAELGPKSLPALPVLLEHLNVADIS